MGRISEKAWLRAIARDIEESMTLKDVLVWKGGSREWWEASGWICEAEARAAQDEMDRECEVTDEMVNAAVDLLVCPETITIATVREALEAALRAKVSSNE